MDITVMDSVHPVRLEMKSQNFSPGKLSHREKAQLATPANCCSFPSWFLLDVVSTHFGDVISTCSYLFFYFGLVYT